MLIFVSILVIVFFLFMCLLKMFIINVGKIEDVVNLKVRVIVLVVKFGGLKFRYFVIMIVLVIVIWLVNNFCFLEMLGMNIFLYKLWEIVDEMVSNNFVVVDNVAVRFLVVINVII